jgi:hypothetical protein
MPTKEGVVLGALSLGGILIHLPLTSISSGEISALFWMIFAMACPHDQTVRSAEDAAMPLEQARTGRV